MFDTTTDDLTLDGPALTDRDPDTLGAGQRRAYRALTEPMLVVPDTDPDGVVTGLYTVYKFNSPGHYTVELATITTCDCPDQRHYQPRAHCKHVRRAKAEIAAERIPAPGEPVGDGHEDWFESVRQDVEERRRYFSQIAGSLEDAL